MNWLPRIGSYDHCISESDFEAEGRIWQVIWFGWVFEISVSKIDRRFGEEAPDAR